MKKIIGFFLPALCLSIVSCNNSAKITSAETSTSDTLKYAEETHFKNIQQLTFGGDNAEAYWSSAAERAVLLVHFLPKMASISLMPPRISVVMIARQHQTEPGTVINISGHCIIHSTSSWPTLMVKS